MQDGDLSNDLTRRYFVVADVVFFRDSTASTHRSGWFTRTAYQRDLWAPDLRVLSMLWQWSNTLGVRLELVFYTDRPSDAGGMWALLEKSAANPFMDWHTFTSPDEVQDLLPYRPDVLGVIDLPQRILMYGGRGLQLENLR